MPSKLYYTNAALTLQETCYILIKNQVVNAV
jgi:hypothetical protein